MSNAPVKRFKSSVSYGLQIAVWKNDGNASFSISKQYKDKSSGEWKESKSLFAADLAAIALLAPEAIAFADSLRNQKSESEPEQRELVEVRTSTAQKQQEQFDSDIPF